MSIVSALELPSVLLQASSNKICLNFDQASSHKNSAKFWQVAIALGQYKNESKGLPLSKTKLIQQAIGLFFSVTRRMHLKETTELGVQVRCFWEFVLDFFL